MYYEVIEVKDLKIQHSPILQCPNPQINEKCSGNYIHTRKWQIECVECMVLHKTIHKHPLLNKCQSKVICYTEYSIEELIEEDNLLYPKNKYGKKRTTRWSREEKITKK